MPDEDAYEAIWKLLDDVQNELTSLINRPSPEAMESEVMRLRDEMKARLQGSAELVQLDGARIARLTEDRETLAAAIAQAAQDMGIYNGEVPLDGAHLLMLLDAMKTLVGQLNEVIRTTTAAYDRARVFVEHVAGQGTILMGNPYRSMAHEVLRGDT